MAVDGWPEPVVHDDRQARPVPAASLGVHLRGDPAPRARTHLPLGLDLRRARVESPDPERLRDPAGECEPSPSSSAGTGPGRYASCSARHRHRGAEVCLSCPAARTPRVFTCFYHHGWAYDGTGRLVSVPDGSSYSAAFDRARTRPRYQPQVESYRGFVFVCFGAAALPAARVPGRRRASDRPARRPGRGRHAGGHRAAQLLDAGQLEAADGERRRRPARHHRAPDLLRDDGQPRRLLAHRRRAPHRHHRHRPGSRPRDDAHRAPWLGVLQRRGGA